MFIIPKANVIESDEGFSLEVLGMTGLRYIQNGKSLHINSELSVAPHDMMIFAADIKKWDSGEPIDENTKGIIIDNVLRAFSWKGIHPDIKYKNKMFTKPKPNLIESDEGYSVEILGKTSLRYIQNNRTVFIELEPSKSTSRINIRAWSINKWESGETINNNMKAIIIGNIGLALASERKNITVKLKR
jgi:hypothetical protein